MKPELHRRRTNKFSEFLLGYVFFFRLCRLYCIKMTASTADDILAEVYKELESNENITLNFDNLIPIPDIVQSKDKLIKSHNSSSSKHKKKSSKEKSKKKPSHKIAPINASSQSTEEKIILGGKDKISKSKQKKSKRSHSLDKKRKHGEKKSSRKKHKTDDDNDNLSSLVPEKKDNNESLLYETLGKASAFTSHRSGGPDRKSVEEMYEEYERSMNYNRETPLIKAVPLEDYLKSKGYLTTTTTASVFLTKPEADTVGESAGQEASALPIRKSKSAEAVPKIGSKVNNNPQTSSSKKTFVPRTVKMKSMVVQQKPTKSNSFDDVKSVEESQSLISEGEETRKIISSPVPPLQVDAISDDEEIIVSQTKEETVPTTVVLQKTEAKMETSSDKELLNQNPVEKLDDDKLITITEQGL